MQYLEQLVVVVNSLILINRTFLRPYRQRHISETALRIKGDFKLDYPVTLHWNGKLLKDLPDDGKIERLHFLVSGKLRFFYVIRFLNATNCYLNVEKVVNVT